MMKKFKQITKPGNPILYRLHQVFNGLYGVSGAGLIAATIWLANLLGHYTYINGIFVGLGILELILFIAVFLAKKSVTKLRFYVFAMMTIFVGQLVYSLMIYGVGFRMVPLIIQDGQDPNQLLTYLTNTAIYSGAICGIHVIQMIIAGLYVGSLRNRNFDFDYKFLEENQVMKKIVKESQFEKEKLNQKINNRLTSRSKKYPTVKSQKQQ